MTEPPMEENIPDSRRIRLGEEAETQPEPEPEPPKKKAAPKKK